MVMGVIFGSMRTIGSGGVAAWKRGRRAILSKPDRETELPGSNESDAEEKGAIERERRHRKEDRQQ